jgi:hypothetical protein
MTHIELMMIATGGLWYVAAFISFIKSIQKSEVAI